MKRELRELGIHRLRDNREFILCGDEGNEYLLFTAQAWEEGGAAEYRISIDGKILSRGVPTRWTVDDLTDTGRTAE